MHPYRKPSGSNFRFLDESMKLHESCMALFLMSFAELLSAGHSFSQRHISSCGCSCNLAKPDADELFRAAVCWTQLQSTAPSKLGIAAVTLQSLMLMSFAEFLSAGSISNPQQD